MRQRLFWPCIALSGLLAACSSNNSAGFVPGNGNVATPGPGPSPVSQSGTINAAQGGTVSVPFAGGTAQVSIPAGAVAQNGAPAAVSVSLTAIGAASQLGQAFQSEARATQSTRKAQSLPSGAQFISAFAVTVTGGQLIAPLKVSIPAINQPTLPNSVARLAIYNPKPAGSNVPSFFDVDTATIANGNVSNDVNPQFVSISVGPGLAQPYVFYGVPAQNAATPAPIALTLTPATAGPFAAFGQTVSVTATGADANGNALAFSPTFALDNAALGTLAPLAGALATTTSLVTGSVSVAGNLTAVDPRTGAKGALALKVQTQRPATKGDSYTYAGSMTQVLARNYPTPNPASVNFYPSPYPTGLTQTVKAGSNQVVTVSPATGGQFDFKTVDTETYNLLQTVTTTDAFYNFPIVPAGGNVTLSSLTTTNAQAAKDPLAYTISQVFATPAIVDILPEIAGASWGNSGASTLTEIDPDGTKSVRTYNADGSYVENTTYPQGSLSSPVPAAQTATITVNGDGSGSYNVPYAGLPNTVISFGTPQPAPSGGLQIPINVVYPPASPGGKNRLFNVTSAAWYGASPTLYAETNTNLGSVAIPATCVVPASFGSKANAIQQTITRTDPVIGYIDRQTNVTYDVLGFGTVCVSYSDVNTAYYDYAGAVADQLPAFRPRRIFVASNGTPISVTTTTQVLGLQFATVAGTSASRLPQSLDATRIYVAKSAFDRKVEALRHDRVMSMLRNVTDNLRSTGGQ